MRTPPATRRFVDRCGNKTAYQYDAAGRTTKIESYKKQDSGSAFDKVAEVSYTYDDFNNMTGIVRGDGMKYALAYNAFHNLESIGVDGKAQKLVSYAYRNGNGRLKEITYANGDVMKATYNGIGQMIAEKWYNAADTLTAHYKYVYDGKGILARAIDIFSQIEYNYLYENRKIIRVAENEITLNSSGIITSKKLISSILYTYDKEDKLTRKRILPASGSERVVYYEYTEDDNAIVKFQAGGKDITSHSKTDTFGRKAFDELQLGTGFVSRQFRYVAGVESEEHIDNGKLKSSPTTQLVSQIVLSDGRTLEYEYDAEERITKVTDSVEGVTEYTYDAQGQLLSETNDGAAVNTMTYDGYGNILTKNGKAYTYGDSTWKDLLTSYDGQSIAYDAQGNPTSYLGHTLAWEKGRQLKSFDSNTYTYNANGVRTSKTVNGVQHTYTLEGSKILREVWGGNTLVPLYDNEGSVCGIIYNDTPYYFFKNLQGDIISITDMDGDVIARYSYDAWGVCTITQDSSTVDIANINPFRYRGYYFDRETGLYYLQSRYYNPTIGRFINVDGLIVWGMIDPTLTSCNLFSYTHNDPINHTDYWGYMEFSSNDNYFVFAFNDWETTVIMAALGLAIAVTDATLFIITVLSAGTVAPITVTIGGLVTLITAVMEAYIALVNSLGGNKGVNFNLTKNIWSRPYIWYNQTEPDGPHNLDELWARIKPHVVTIVETYGYIELRKISLMVENHFAVKLAKMIISEYKSVPVAMPPIC